MGRSSEAKGSLVFMARGVVNISIQRFWRFRMKESNRLSSGIKYSMASMWHGRIYGDSDTGRGEWSMAIKISRNRLVYGVYKNGMWIRRTVRNTRYGLIESSIF